MKWMQQYVVLVLSALLPRLGGGVAIAGVEASTPVGRVVGLLQGLKTKLEQDFEAEKDLFERYECWHNSIVNTKTATNAAAQSRKESLEQYIQDIDAGKFEFTTERVDMEKQIAGLSQDLQIAGDLRAKENEDFLAAKQEMEQAIAALQQAIQVLEDGAPSSLLAQRSKVSSATARQSLEVALHLGRSTLGMKDLRLLERMVAGDVPQWDWKKLNRKATFKTKYGSQTGHIVSTLKGLEATFSENLAEANRKEDDAQASYLTLKGSKEGMLTRAQEALVDLVAEHGARALTKSEAQAEVDALGAQITDDTKFIDDTASAFVVKKQEWADRERLRQMEISAFAEAISVLHSDEARDTLKTSYKRKGYLFFQAAQINSAEKPKRARFVQALQKLATASSDRRLSLIATAASTSTGTRSIAAVIVAIDDLLASLRAEEGTDLTNKEQCESQRSERTRLAKTQSVAIDETTEEIVRAQAKVEELQAQIKEQDQAIIELNGTLVTLERQRADENQQYVEDKADDQKAVLLIEQAAAVLTKLKEDLLAGVALRSKVVRHMQTAEEGIHLHDHGDTKAEVAAAAAAAGSRVAAAKPQHRSSLIHGRSSMSQRQPFDVQAGEAPPPPPATWAEPAYTGSTHEQTGISAILTLLKDDIEADIVAADKSESDAVVAYGEQKGEVEAAISAANDAITGYEAEKAAEDSTIVNKGGERSTKKGELEGTMAEIKAMEPGCDFLLINYGVRRTSRQNEIDGLVKAKAYLQGADFA